MAVAPQGKDDATMALELIAAIVSALALAGIAHLARRLSAGRLPRWLVPVAAGVGLIGFTIWSEYAWYGRTAAGLPEGVPVVWVERDSNPLRPWSYLAPITLRFIALDRREMAQHPGNPALRLARIYQFARWRPVEDRMMVFDCAAGRQIGLTEGIEISPDGVLTGADWVVPGTDDGFQKAACQED